MKTPTRSLSLVLAAAFALLTFARPTRAQDNAPNGEPIDRSVDVAKLAYDSRFEISYPGAGQRR